MKNQRPETQQWSPSTTDQSTEVARILRLIGVAKVWGAVKYFHPYLAYRDILMKTNDLTDSEVAAVQVMLEQLTEKFDSKETVKA